jgi:hypothetical protein
LDPFKPVILAMFQKKERNWADISPPTRLWAKWIIYRFLVDHNERLAGKKPAPLVWRSLTYRKVYQDLSNVFGPSVLVFFIFYFFLFEN